MVKTLQGQTATHSFLPSQRFLSMTGRIDPGVCLQSVSLISTTSIPSTDSAGPVEKSRYFRVACAGKSRSAGRLKSVVGFATDAGVLNAVKVRIDTALGEQFSMRSNLGNLALIQHHDTVRVFDR